MPTNPESELRVMVGDLFMQIAVLRAELQNTKELLPPPEEPKPNGKEKADEQSHRDRHKPSPA